MQFEFRDISAAEMASPGAGELLLAHARESSGRRLAQTVCEEGLDEFPRGEGAVEKLVVQSEPTLDDMLAAALAERLLSGEPLPDGADTLARYAALAREGLNPGDAPLEKSLAGLYLAIRSAAGEQLGTGDKGARFASDWRRMARVIFEAAESSQNPFGADPIFESEGEFARELAFLAKDREIYDQDIGRGERWRARIPGGPRASSALLLKSPRSVLFKHWCRADQRAPAGNGYLLLAVDWGAGNWIISTDPVQRLSLLALWEQLQAREKARNADSAEADPWFDGAPFENTLVASPKAGTSIPEKDVRRAIQQWSGKRLLDSPQSRWVAALSTAFLLLAVLLMVFWPHAPVQPSLHAHVASVQFDGKEIRGVRPIGDSPTRQGGQIELMLRKGPNTVVFEVPRRYQVDWSVLLDVSCLSEGKPQAESIRVRVNDDAFRPSKKTNAIVDLPTVFRAGRNSVRVEVHSAKQVPATVTVAWKPNKNRPPTLHVMAVGVSEYSDSALGNLNYADDDAEAIAELLAKPLGVYRPPDRVVKLTNAEATRSEIIAQLKALAGRPDILSTDLLVLTLSGHGGRGSGRQYDFFAHKYSRHQSDERVSWNDLTRELKDVPCKVIVIIDTCHSGQATMDMQGLVKDLRESSDRFVIAASKSQEQALEERSWQHGALTLAVLEALSGRHLHQAGRDERLPATSEDGVLTLLDLYAYAVRRVAQLTDSRQKVVANNTGNVDLLIPLTARPTK